jgi:hypothetical protein
MNICAGELDVIEKHEIHHLSAQTAYLILYITSLCFILLNAVVYFHLVSWKSIVIGVQRVRPYRVSVNSYSFP